MHAGPPLQPYMQNIVLRNRLNPVAFLADIRQAFLRIWIDERDRDAFRFFWVKDLTSFEIVKFRFAKLPFGCTSSPFILNGTLHEHLEYAMVEHVEVKEVL